MCRENKEIQVMEDLEKFFEERERRERRFKMIIELKVSDLQYTSPSFLFSEPVKKKQKIVKVKVSSNSGSKSDIF